MDRTLLLAAILVVLCGCKPGAPAGAPRQPDASSPSLTDKAPPAEPPADAVARLSPTQGSAVTGSLALSQSPQGVRVTGAVQNLKPNSAFGFHIHETGDCGAPDAGSAGGHFNPMHQPHGDPTSSAAHVGDMVNLRSNQAGVAQVDTTASRATIASGGATDVLGKAIIVHESADDYATQPAGNSGSRLACGVITRTSATNARD